MDYWWCFRSSYGTHLLTPDFPAPDQLRRTEATNPCDPNDIYGASLCNSKLVLIAIPIPFPIYSVFT